VKKFSQENYVFVSQLQFLGRRYEVGNFTITRSTGGILYLY